MLKTDTNIIIIGTAIVLLFGFLTSYLVSSSSPQRDFSGSWSCMADYKLCPDGSEVYRTPPYCQFADCPR
jgi:hypothetical protein